MTPVHRTPPSLPAVRRSLLDPLLDFLYPPLCISCGKSGPGQEGGVCARCWSALKRVGPEDELWREMEPRLAAGGAVDGLLSCFLFEREGVLQRILHSLKYEGIKSAGVRLGREVGRLLAASPPWSDAACIVPVPLHKARRRERGYNQSETIARGASGACGIPVTPSLLARTRDTESQTKLDAGERRKNVEGAFAARTRGMEPLSGKTVIVMDDVITSGATIRACALELRRAGAARVLAASAALAR